MDTQKIRELLDQREKIDAEIIAAVSGESKRKPASCSKCGEEGHTARSCQKP